MRFKLGMCRHLGVIVLLAVLMAGCAGVQFGKRDYSQDSTVTQNEVEVFFPDVLTPSELKIDKKTTSILRTPGFSSGVLAMKGRVEMTSLVNFFKVNMEKDNWRQLSEFRSHRSMMLFSKTNRWCVIHISESEFSTYVEIWVTQKQPGSGGGPVEIDEGLLK